MASTELAGTRISRTELVALLAMMAATVAFSIDAMLPVLPLIAEDVSAPGAGEIGLVLTTFLVGMGFGTLFAGPLSDAFGRHPVALCGAAVYIVCALIAAQAQTFESLLLARLVQGVGASGPRIMALAIIRDLYSGRAMAQMVSFVMTVFALVPVLAPGFGVLLAAAFGWRSIFWAFAIFSFVSMSWLVLRQPETLPVENRRPFALGTIGRGIAEVMTTPTVLPAILAQTLVYSILFGALMSAQPIIDVVFGRDEAFFLWFGLVSAISAAASFLNARIVVRLGMRRVIRAALLGMILYSAAYLILLSTLEPNGFFPFALFLGLLIYCFSLAGLGIGNLNAIAMLPLGHMAGIAASIISAISTTAGAALAVPGSISFDGTPLPLTVSLLLASILAWAIVRSLPASD